jgi:hypothetical protein
MRTRATISTRLPHQLSAFKDPNTAVILAGYLFSAFFAPFNLFIYGCLTKHFSFGAWK